VYAPFALILSGGFGVYVIHFYAGRTETMRKK
jgi:hypothetical protein